MVGLGRGFEEFLLLWSWDGRGLCETGKGMIRI